MPGKGKQENDSGGPREVSGRREEDEKRSRNLGVESKGGKGEENAG